MSTTFGYLILLFHFIRFLHIWINIVRRFGVYHTKKNRNKLYIFIKIFTISIAGIINNIIVIC